MGSSKPIHQRFTNKNDIYIRHLVILLFALFFGSLNTFNKNQYFFETYWFKEVFFNFIYIAAIWNINIFLIDVNEKKIKWHNNIKMKLLLVLIIAMSLPIIIHYFFNIYIYPIIFGKPCELNTQQNITFLIISITITLLINSIFTAIEFFNYWRQTLTEKEKLKRESLTAEFETLKVK